MATSRQIRLKEFPANSIQYLTPPKLYLANRPNLSSEKSFLLRTDEFGAIMPANYFRSADKIVFMGGSSTENKYCNESQRFTSVLQKNLLKKNLQAQVLNFGYSGSNLLHIFNVIFNKVIPMAPKVIVIVIPANEKRTLCLESTYWNNDKHYSNFFPPPEGRDKFDTKWRERIDDSKKILKIIKMGCELYGIKIAVHSVINNGNSYDEFNSSIEEFCSEEGVLFIDAGRFENIQSIRETGFYDKEHLNEIGSEFLGENIFSILSDAISFKEIESGSNTNFLNLRVFDKIQFKTIPLEEVANLDKFIEENGVISEKPVESNIPIKSRQTVKESGRMENLSYLIDE